MLGLGVLGKLLSLPYSGIAYCFEKVIEMAETEYYDDAVVKEELLVLQLQLEEGDIDEMEYRRREAPILVRLREIKEHRTQQLEELIAARGSRDSPVVIDLPDTLR